MANQYVEIDGEEHAFVQGVFGIFGHGNVTGIGEALEYNNAGLTYYRSSNEQGMVHTATAFAKQSNRLKIFACTSSGSVNTRKAFIQAVISCSGRKVIV